MGKRLRPWLEVLLAQLAILLLTWPLGFAFASLASLALLLAGIGAPGREGFGAAALLMLAVPVALLLVFALLWFLAWRFWFRSRMPRGRFLLAWSLSLLLLVLLWAGWAIAVGYFLR